MKREIKFRGRRLDNGGWAYGLLYYSYGTGVWSITCSDGWVPSYGNPDQGEGTLFHAIDPQTIGQYTGLKNCQGNEVYESDILTGGFVVTFFSGAFGFWVKENSIPEFFMLYRYLGNKKVIGNIYENSELIKDK